MKKLTTALAIALGLTLALPVIAGVISPKTIAGAKTVNAKQAKKLFDRGVIFIDVRKDKPFAAGRVPDAVHITFKKFRKKTLGEHVKLNQPVVIYSGGHESLEASRVVRLAVKWGYKKVYYYRDGFPSWKKSGYPVE